MPAATRKLIVLGTEYDLEITRTETGISAQAFLDGQPASPEVFLAVSAQQLGDADTATFTGDSSELLRAVYESALGYVRDNLKHT